MFLDFDLHHKSSGVKCSGYYFLNESRCFVVLFLPFRLIELQITKRKMLMNLNHLRWSLDSSVCHGMDGIDPKIVSKNSN